MDIERLHFWDKLPTILRHIAESHFIAFDLELSGIPVRSRAQQSDVKQSLSERYEELKEAAQTYHILQVGITCVTEDRENRRYILRSYNFNLSPLIYEDLDFERKLTYSSGAVAFLLSHGYQMESPFSIGIPYLTAADGKLAKEQALKKWDRRAIPDLKLKKSDTKANEFVNRVKQEISSWVKHKKPSTDFLKIKGEKAPLPHDQNNRVPLSGYERRLVHQMVRNEFPNLQTYGKSDYVQVTIRDIDRDKRESSDLQRRISQAVCRQTGFRWVADALAGRSLLDIELSCIDFRDDSNRPIGSSSTHRKLEELSSILQRRRKVLVGHNCFMDLVYFYQHFYGDLPDTLEEFQAAIKENFHVVMDTKYIATSGPNAAAYRNLQLWQIWESVANHRYPQIEVASGFSSDNGVSNYHEAGFDSLVTAKVFLKLLAGPGQENRDVATQNLQGLRIANNEKEAFDTTSSNQSRLQTKPKRQSQKSKSRSEADPAVGKAIGKNKKSPKNIYDLLPEPSEEGVSRSEADPEVGKGVGKNQNPPRNIYDLLPEPLEGGVSLSAETPVSSSNLSGMRVLPNRDKVEEKQSSRAPLLPSWDSPMWKIHGNKIRVYGTIEESWEFSDGDQPIRESEDPATSESTYPKSQSLWDFLGLSRFVSSEGD